MKTLTTLSFALFATVAFAQNKSIDLTVIPTNPSQASTSMEIRFSNTATDWVDALDSGSTATVLADNSNVHAFTMSIFTEVISGIDSRTPINRDREIYMGFYTTDSSQIQLSASTFGFTANDSTCTPAYVWLENSITGQIYSLLNNTVTLQLTPNTDFHTEYVLHMGPRVLKSATSESCYQSGNGTISIYNYNNYDWKYRLYQNGLLYATSSMDSCTAKLSNLPAATYQVVVYNNVIPVDSSVLVIAAAPSLAPVFTLSDYAPVENTVIDFFASSNGGLAYAWDFGDGFTDSISNPSHAYVAGGSYTASLSVTSAAGCTETYNESISVTMAPAAGPQQAPQVHQNLFDPNSQSPNTARASAPQIGNAPGKIIVNRKVATGNMSVVVMNMNGQLISTITSADAQIEIAVPASGIYLVTMTDTDNSITSEKVMINN